MKTQMLQNYDNGDNSSEESQVWLVLNLALTILEWGWVAFALVYCFGVVGRFWRFGGAALLMETCI